MIAQHPPLLITHDQHLSAEDAAHSDARVLAEYHDLAPWGLSTAIDLGGCDPQAIRDRGHIERFVVALCAEIEMRRHGDPIIVRFGDDPRVSGYSLCQLIETSLISGHFAEESGSAFLDIFSCKAYPPYHTALFCRDWFGAQTVRVACTYRFSGIAPQALRSA